MSTNSGEDTISEALWRAAKDTDIPDIDDEMNWILLRMSLKCSGVDCTKRQPGDWQKSFQKLRRYQKKEERREKEARESSTESERGSHVSVSDSAYQSDDARTPSTSSTNTRGKSRNSHIQEVFDVTVFVDECDDSDGELHIAGCLADDTEEDYILETILRRLGLSRGKDGRVVLKYSRGEVSKISKSSFAVRNDKDGHADIVFTSKPKKNLRPAVHNNGIRNSRNNSRCSTRYEQPEESAVQKSVENILVGLFLDERIQQLNDEGVEDLGRKVTIAVRGANKTAAEP